MPLVKLENASPGLLDARADFQAPEAEAHGFTDVFARAMRLDNPLGAAAAADEAFYDVNNEMDADYNAWEDVKGTPYEAHYRRFATDANNATYAQALKAKIDQETEDRRVIQGSGAVGVLASLGAGLLDPTMLVPGAGVVKSAKGGYTLGKSALSVGLEGATGAAISEAALQSAQETRSGAESGLNVGGGLVLGGLLGAGAAQLLTKSEKAAALKGFDALVEGANGGTPVRASVGAASVDGLSREDLTMSTAEGFGATAKVLADATPDFNPMLRAQHSPFASQRQTVMELADNTVYQAAHDAGRTTGASVETEIAVAQGRIASARQVHETLYADLKKAGGEAMSKADFNRRVGQAMRRGDADPHGNDYVSKAAQAWRERVFDPMKDEAIRLGLLPEDVSVEEASSYFMRLYNRERLVRQEGAIKDGLRPYFEGFLHDSFKADSDRLAKRTADLDQKLADLTLAPDERVRLLQELEDEGKLLDEAHPDEVDRVSRVNELRDRAAKAKEAGDHAAAKAAKDEAKRIEAEGGKALKDYREQRKSLRGRHRSVDLGYAGLADRAAKVERAIAANEEAAVRSVAQLVRRGRRLELELRRLSPERAAEKIADLREAFMNLAAKADKSLERTRAQIDKLVESGEVGDAAARLEQEAARQADYTERLSKISDRLEAAEALDPEAVLAELREAVEQLNRDVAERAMSRGEKAARLRERYARLDPARLDAKIKALEALKKKHADAHYERWSKHDPNFNGGRAPSFGDTADEIVESIYAKLTGRDYGDGGSLDYAIPIPTGPLKGRTFHAPDELLERLGMLEDDIDVVGEAYLRRMAAQNALVRKFGSVDLKDQLAKLRAEAADLRKQVSAAPDIAAARQIAGAPKSLALGKDLPQAKEKLLAWLDKYERNAVTDIEGLRDLHLGRYALKENASNFGRISRALSQYNFIRAMGGAAISNFADLYRAAQVHGLRNYLGHGVGALIGNTEAAKLSVKEAKLAGLVAERWNHHRFLSMGEMGDPYRQGTAAERWMHNGMQLASKWSGMAHLTDFVESTAAMLSQNRILEAALSGKDRRMLAYLGIDDDMSERIGREFANWGDETDGVHVANTEKWTDPEAVRAYRNAVSKDVRSIATRRGAADAPLFANTPLGRLLFQFRTFTMASLQRVTLRGLQESKARYVQGVVASTAIGMLVATLKAWRGGEERWEKFKTAAKNPGYLIAEGLDASGQFALFFEVANQIEAMTAFGGHRFNPLKSPLMGAGRLLPGEQGGGGESIRFAGRDPAMAMLGPSAGIPAAVASLAGVGADLATGQEVSARKARTAIGGLPYSSYLAAREGTQMLFGDSPYLPE